MNQIYTWQEFDKDVKKLADKITEDPNYIFDSIYGIPRGGLIPAVKLSHIFETPMIYDINQINHRTLVVDEIVDTGETALKLTQRLKKKNIKVKIVCLHYRSRSDFVPYKFVRKLTNDNFITYPWDI